MRTTMRQRMGIIVAEIFLIVLCLVMIFPFYWMLTSSFKPIGRIFTDPIVLLPTPFTINSYFKLLTETAFPRWYLNSVIFAVFYPCLAIFFSTLAGFGFAKYYFKGRNVLMMIVLVSMMIPLHAVMIPIFILLIKIKWVNSYWGVIIPFAANPFGIFFVRQYLASVPTDLIYAGRIDGCSEFGLYARIMLPLMKPAIGVLVIYFAMISWNWFLWPLVVMREGSMFPLNVGMATFVSDYRILYDQLMAAAVLCTLPLVILFLLMQRQFISGLTAGAVKQ
jgi:arabinosaccharide transport system permease protein